MKLLFGQAYHLRFDPKLWTAMQPFPPLGSLYAAAVAREPRQRQEHDGPACPPDLIRLVDHALHELVPAPDLAQMEHLRWPAANRRR